MDVPPSISRIRKTVGGGDSAHEAPNDLGDASRSSSMAAAANKDFGARLGRPIKKPGYFYRILGPHSSLMAQVLLLKRCQLRDVSSMCC